MSTLTSQVDNLNKRVVALENSELSESESVPFISKLYAAFTTKPPLKCSTSTRVRVGQKITIGSELAANELAAKINFGALGTGAVPTPGAIGVVGEAARKPVGTITILDSTATETTIILSSYFDEQTANDLMLTSAAVLYDATEAIGTGKVVTSGPINIEKTAAKTITVSAEITITEV